MWVHRNSSLVYFSLHLRAFSRSVKCALTNLLISSFDGGREHPTYGEAVSISNPQLTNSLFERPNILTLYCLPSSVFMTYPCSLSEAITPRN